MPKWYKLTIQTAIKQKNTCQYLSFAVEVSVTHTVIFHFKLEHPIHIRQFELCNKEAICNHKRNMMTEVKKKLHVHVL